MLENITLKVIFTELAKTKNIALAAAQLSKASYQINKEQLLNFLSKFGLNEILAILVSPYGANHELSTFSYNQLIKLDVVNKSLSSYKVDLLTYLKNLLTNLDSLHTQRKQIYVDLETWRTSVKEKQLQIQKERLRQVNRTIEISNPSNGIQKSTFRPQELEQQSNYQTLNNVSQSGINPLDDLFNLDTVENEKVDPQFLQEIMQVLEDTKKVDDISEQSKFITQQNLFPPVNNNVSKKRDRDCSDLTGTVAKKPFTQ